MSDQQHSDQPESTHLPPSVGGRRGSLSWWQEMVRQARLSWRLFRDSRVPLLTRLIPPATIAYVLSPVDLVPDVLLGLGQLDDIAILFLGTKLFIDLCPTDIVREHLRALGASIEEWRTEEIVEGEFQIVEPGDTQE